MTYRARLEKTREDGFMRGINGISPTDSDKLPTINNLMKGPVMEDGDYNKIFLMDRIIKGRSIGIRMYGMGCELRDSIYTVPA